MTKGMKSKGEAPFVSGLRRALAARPDKNPTNVAAAAGMDNSAVRKMLDGVVGAPSVTNAAKIAKALDMTVDQILFLAGESQRSTIAIAGKVGAGARVPLVDAYEKGDGPQVECPPGLSGHGVVAVEVEGDSMEPVYSAGDLIFYSRDTHDNVPAEAVGHRCVVEDMDGNAWVKQVKPGRDPGTFDLHSINAAVATMYGVPLKWAARVRLHWPADLAVRKE